jgi:hypothetical protein
MAGGTTVVIAGVNFTGTYGVNFGAVSASYTLDSDTQITAVSPPTATAGDAAVSVSTPDGYASMDFTYLGPVHFVPPGEDTVSPVAIESPVGVPVPPIWNALMKYYPARRRGRAVWKLPFVDDTTAAAYTFDQPFPTVSGEEIARGNAHPPPGGGPFDQWSNLTVQTYDKVFYGGHEYEITDDEAAGLTAFLLANNYDPAESIFA